MPKRKETEFTKVNLRLQEGLRRRLEQEAKRNHVSLNSEMLKRLEASLQLDQRLVQTFGGEHNLTLFKLIRDAIAIIEINTGKRWTDDPALFLRTVGAVSEIMRS